MKIKQTPADFVVEEKATIAPGDRGDFALYLLRKRGVGTLEALRAIQAEPLPAGEAVEWACRSIDLAAEGGATACTVIPTRGGNGAMEAIGDAFVPPHLPALEAVIEYGLGLRRARPFGPADMRVFADLWDIERFFACTCAPALATRLAAMNREQRTTPRVACACRE